MGRFLMLVGMVAFTVGMVALSKHGKSLPGVRLPKTPQPRPYVPLVAGPAYHMTLSLN